MHRDTFQKLLSAWLYVGYAPTSILDGSHINLHRTDPARQEVRHRNGMRIINKQSNYIADLPMTEAHKPKKKQLNQLNMSK